MKDLALYFVREGLLFSMVSSMTLGSLTFRWERASVAFKEHGKISVFDTKAEHGSRGEHEIVECLKLLKKIEDLDHLKRLDLMQKAKLRWAIEGDENSKFFHGIVNNKFSRSRINGLFIEGNWTSKPSAIIDHIFQFHKRKFENKNHHRPLFTSNLFKKLSETEISILDAPFSCQEIKDAVWGCGGSKAPEVEALHVSLQEAKSKGIFEGVNIGSTIRYIDKAILVPFGNEIRWNNSIPIKINIHNWRLLNDRLPTRMNLDIRDMDLNSTHCPVCDDALETAQHLFIDCTIARNLWVMIQKWRQLADYPKDLQSLIF
uniref:Reverse transcriptase zinc-binding domain-containing protein n=1 Tax=Tanacetum cinerariifolium TaxID=118510 RepID=A0A6L2NZY5_TANCI|nr:reverse transcriptase zinc-binding domain-containing protein [Tanacetum cinerariifolium]